MSPSPEPAIGPVSVETRASRSGVFRVMRVSGLGSTTPLVAGRVLGPEHRCSGVSVPPAGRSRNPLGGHSARVGAVVWPSLLLDVRGAAVGRKVYTPRFHGADPGVHFWGPEGGHKIVLKDVRPNCRASHL